MDTDQPGAAEPQPKREKTPEKIAQRRGDAENCILSILLIHVDISPVPGRGTGMYRIYRIPPSLQNHRDLHRFLKTVVQMTEKDPSLCLYYYMAKSTQAATIWR
jgi:hypothetical protein